MADDRLIEAKKTIALLQEELERFKRPPYLSATVLEVGKKTARVAIDGVGTYEIPADEELKRRVKRGSRVVLNPESKAAIDYSEFNVLGGDVAIVDEVLGDNRVRIQNKGETSIVLTAVDRVKSGDEIMLDPTKTVALERFSRKKTKYALEEVPNAPWDNIGGLEETIAKIKQEVEEPFRHKEVFAKYGRRPAKGILLYGPPGCGKTMIGKSIAYNLAQVAGDTKGTKTNGHFIKINGPEILDKWVGNSEATIRRIYESARETADGNGSPVVVFIDEAEAVLKARGSGISSDVYDSIVPQFLAEMDGLNGHYNVITVLATNREDIIDPAILRDGRVDRRIKVPRPNQKGAKDIFEIYLRGKPLNKKTLRPEDVAGTSEELAREIYDDKNIVYSVVSPQQGVLGNFTYRNLISGAMIKGIVDRASTYAINREIQGGETGITRDDLQIGADDEFREHSGFSQALVRDDWETVFGSQGRQYQEACNRGYLVLEKMLKETIRRSK